MPADQQWDQIELAAKVIGHISQGMYRSPAGAIKELISNAYDAGATRVKIHTGFPVFAEFICEDNGCGIAENEFRRLMKGGIGDSTKSTAEASGKFNRPIIGRLGVGMLSLAQICSQFSLTSYHPESETAFRASIKFPPYTRRQIDQIVAELKESGKDYVKSGQYQIEKIPYKKGETGLKITTTHLRETFKRTMASLANLGYLKTKRSKQSYPSFDQFIEAITLPEVSTLSFAAPYDTLLFGLALASPLPYLDTRDGNIREPLLLKIPKLREIQDKLRSYKFKVEIDNIELRRPILLPSNKFGTKEKDCVFPKAPRLVEFELKDGDHEERVSVELYDIGVKKSEERYQAYYFDYSTKLNGMPFSFSGYIFMQTTRLFPKEYQGVLVRLKNVAIGQYDVNVMTYPNAEGPRFSMLSSEIFVHEGLDDALKVDRDGFNTLDAHYIRLQAYLHHILHEKIFPGSWVEEKQRNKKKREAKASEQKKVFAAKVRTATDRKITKIDIINEKAEEDAELASIDKRSGHITINEAHPDAKALFGKKKHHQLAEQILVAFEIANQGKTPEIRKDTFYKLIRGLFDE